MVLLNKEYEMRHWRKKRDKNFSRAAIMKDMFKIPLGVKKVADVGCGPLCGIFGALRFDTMYAVDVLWDAYIKEGLESIPEGVKILSNSAQHFTLPEKVDIIFSFNALDHSGNLRQGILNILNNLKEKGLFCLHIHLRTKDQLNAGHSMIVKYEEIDKILKSCIILKREIRRDPFLSSDSRKNYLTYITTVQRR